MPFHAVRNINIPVENFGIGITYIKILDVVYFWFLVTGAVFPDIHQVEVLCLGKTFCNVFN